MSDNHRRFSLWVAALLAIYGALGWVCLPYATFYGDLTRMGLLPEADFGWRAPQPRIPEANMVSSSLREADILVIGDSFSESLVWQSILVEKGLKVRTLIWGEVPALCEGVPQWLAAQGFKGRRIIIQSVEWKFAAILKRSKSCLTMEGVKSLADGTRRAGSPPRTMEESVPTASGRMSVGVRTVVNGARLKRGTNSFGSVTVQRLEKGCQWFSHRACSQGLFLDYEKEHPDFGTETVADMNMLSRRLPGYQVTWLIVPDKSTVYLHPEKSFWRQASRQLNLPDVLGAFQKVLPKQIDLYKPNDSHLSSAGYLELGRLAYESLNAPRTTLPASLF